MIENEKALSSIELEILNIIGAHPRDYVSIPVLRGWYRLEHDYDFDIMLCRLCGLNLLYAITDFPANVMEPAYSITQEGKEYLRKQQIAHESVKQSKKAKKREFNYWLAPIIVSIIVAAFGLFAPEIRAFFHLFS